MVLLIDNNEIKWRFIQKKKPNGFSHWIICTFNLRIKTWADVLSVNDTEMNDSIMKRKRNSEKYRETEVEPSRSFDSQGEKMNQSTMNKHVFFQAQHRFIDSFHSMTVLK